MEISICVLARTWFALAMTVIRSHVRSIPGVLRFGTVARHAQINAQTLCRHACPTNLAAGLLALAVFASGTKPARADVTEAWVHRYKNVVNNADDQAFKMARDAAGDIFVIGSSMRVMQTVKYSGADGALIWQQQGPSNPQSRAYSIAVDASGDVVVTGPYGDDRYTTVKYAGADGALLWHNDHIGSANSNDYASAMVVDSAGNVVVTGASTSGLPNGNYGYFTAKYAAADGALIWEKRYSNRANGGDTPYAVAVDGHDNVVVTGESYNASNSDYYTAKYAAADGALLWEKRYNDHANGGDYANALAVDGGGNVVVTGRSATDDVHFGIYTAKYAAANGALLWEKRYKYPVNSDGYDYAYAVAVDGSGNVVVTGTSGSFYYTAKYMAADGMLVWEKRSTIRASGRGANALAVDASGNVVMTGSTGNFPDGDYYTAKYAATDGALLWEKRYNGPANSDDIANAVVVDDQGNVVVTGFSASGKLARFSDPYDFYTVKYAAADGALLWEQRFDGPRGNYDLAQAVAVDGSGDFVVTGSSGTAISDDGLFISDYYTAKYAAATGALLWEKRYNGPANSDDQAKAVAVDGSGNVVVTGFSDNRTNEFNYYTAKYAATNGALLWEKRANGGGEAVVVDVSGNVVVMGPFFNSRGNIDYYTAKYAAADGALVWEKRYNGSADGNDLARALAVDGSGNVVVTGASYNGTNTYQDYYTAKYAAADGTLVWEKRYNGPANGNDQAQAVAVDGNGNVVVTGWSASGGTYGWDYPATDFYTAKYASADGALLWENRYNGLEDPKRGDRANAVAVDGNGNVVVTGWSYSTNSIGYYTAKYAAADGSLLWEQRYNDPGGVRDLANTLALDRVGNVVMTGSASNGSNFDYYTAKYSATDGEILWERRYNGPTSGDDKVGSGRSLALGPKGMVAVTGISSGDYATVVYRETLPPISVALVTTGLRLRFTGVSGRSYNIERASDLSGPWSALATPIAPPGGFIDYVDTNPPAVTAFYRASTP